MENNPADSSLLDQEATVPPQEQSPQIIKQTRQRYSILDKAKLIMSKETELCEKQIQNGTIKRLPITLQEICRWNNIKISTIEKWFNPSIKKDILTRAYTIVIDRRISEDRDEEWDTKFIVFFETYQKQWEEEDNDNPHANNYYQNNI
jgi:hypothetical protein